MLCWWVDATSFKWGTSMNWRILVSLSIGVAMILGLAVLHESYAHTPQQPCYVDMQHNDEGGQPCK